MINLISKLLRREPAPPKEPPRVQCSFTSASFNAADPADIGAERTREILKRIAAGKFFEIRY
jgi:hypothetical protein